MITLDSEMVGNLAPPSKLTTGTTSEGKSVAAIPYARLPRMERLKISGKADTTEDNSGDELEVDGKKESHEEREKRRMRGKGKSLSRYLRKQRKNVIDPTAVRSFLLFFRFCITIFFFHRLPFELSWRSKRRRNGGHWLLLPLERLGRRKSHLLWTVSKRQSDLQFYTYTVCHV